MENKSCSRCKYLDRYYTKGVNRFNRTDLGFCRKRRESVNVRECRCESYEVDRYIGRIGRRAVKVCLNDLLTQITEIRKVIEANADDAEQEE
ncbi:MAG: hypothetical protein K2L88_07290 [Clostridiales bacterium]|nr:hypothetical protein [Clostridiales bacterium]